MSELDSTSGVVALAALVLALAALVLIAILHSRLRDLREAQPVVLGEAEGRDLVAKVEDRLSRALSHSAVVRYDAYNEMSGRQSSSIALLDDNADGVIVSSILHREQARVYAKRVSAGESDLGISPEEREAIDTAMAAGSGSAGRH